MRIARVTVLELFGIFDHDIELKLDKQITIIHGLNGYGKTIILKMLYGLLSNSYDIFVSVPFSKFQVFLDDKSSLVIEKISKPTEINQQAKRRSTPRRGRRRKRYDDLKWIYIDPTGKRIEFKLDALQLGLFDESMRREIDSYLPSHLTMTEDGWFDYNKGELVPTKQILVEYAHFLAPVLPSLQPNTSEAEQPTILNRMQHEIHAHLIETERLRQGGEPSLPPSYANARGATQIVTMTVERYSQEIMALIANVLAMYARRSSELDRTFPIRLLEQKTKEAQTTSDLRELFKGIELRRRELVELGFLDPEEGDPLRDIPDSLYTSAPDVLSVYIKDTEEKLSTFSEIARKIGVLTRILNERFKHKSFRIQRDKGFVFETKMGELPASALSSGEQHEVILIYELLFKVERNWLVMLDEPEISLHVAWQEKFLDDLQEIVKLSNVHVLIATHSPTIIGPYWNELTVALKPPKNLQDVERQ